MREEVSMMKEYNSIRLFKKNRESVTNDLIQEPTTKDDLTDSEQQLPELIIRPLGFKDKETSLTNSEQLPLSPGIEKVIQKVFTFLGVDLKDISLLDLVRTKDVVLKSPIWSIFKKPQ